jgi:radical SAM protein
MSTAPHGSRHAARDYTQTPLNIYWEMTQACALACKHCRAEAMPHAHPDQLSFNEAVSLIRQIPEFGQPMPHLILTGGDPLERPDLYEILDEARRTGVGVSITPAATTALTRQVLEQLKMHGIEGLGLSLDGSAAERHDNIRGVAGTFDRTMQAIRWAQELEIPLQVNTLVAKETAGDMQAIYELLEPFAVARWSLFFLISVGRGKVLEALEPQDAEQLMSWIYETAKSAPFIVATTEAPSYRRVAIEHMRDEGKSGDEIRRSNAVRGFGIRDGHGILFISHTGEICPAGFLPLAAGNVRRDHLVDVYRRTPLFESLHDPVHFEGRCGVCEYRVLCGGSRARAFSATGDPLATDPLCDYQPSA